MGSKNRIAKEILPIILKDRKEDQWYVEPMAGGMNSICEVEGNRIANDLHFNLIEMWKRLVIGWTPENIEKEAYKEIRINKNQYEPCLVGWVGFNCSYSGKWFGGFAGKTKTKIGTIRDYQAEAIKNVTKQVDKMQGVVFKNRPYYELEFPINSIIYCDPPYEGTTKYKDDFNHNDFWQWCREKTKEGHSVFISEYNAPKDFECIWKKQVSSSLSANGKIGGNKISIEKLFIYSPNKTDTFNENLHF